MYALDILDFGTTYLIGFSVQNRIVKTFWNIIVGDLSRHVVFFSSEQCCFHNSIASIPSKKIIGDSGLVCSSCIDLH